MKTLPALKFHASYGYATAEQIARLQSDIPAYERRKIMDALKKQNEQAGKWK